MIEEQFFPSSTVQWYDTVATSTSSTLVLFNVMNDAILFC